MTVKEAYAAWKAAVAEQAKIEAEYEANGWSLELAEKMNIIQPRLVNIARINLRDAKAAAAPPLKNDGWDVADQHLDDDYAVNDPRRFEESR